MRSNKQEALYKLEEMARVCDSWERLNQHFGDSKGIKFLKIALGFVLGNLLDTANYYLKTLCDRYSLRVVPPTLHIAVEDAYQGFTRRSTKSLSGGESFLVSLSLALALANIGQNLAVDTLFIDEGFGTLSGQPLTDAITTLKSLHDKSGRHVGIISHIQDVRERIPVQILVEKTGNLSASTVTVTLD